MIQYLLMGAQIAGAISDVYGQHQSYKMSKRAQQFEEGQINLRMQQEGIASQQQSLLNLESLQEVLATQRAFAGARGFTPGVGSALAVEQKSIHRFRQDEKARELSLSFLQQQRKAQIAMSKVGLAGKKAQFGTSLMKTGFGLLSPSQTIGDTGQQRDGALTLE
jgi:hypothetical protein